jgi:hypothetical protein
MKRAMSQGQAMRSIFGRSRVTQRDEAPAGLGSTAPPDAFHASMPPSR